LRKNRIPLLITAALLAAALFAGTLAGCGGDEGKARKYIESAQEKSKKIMLVEKKLRKKGEEFLKFLAALPPNITPDIAATVKKFFGDTVDLVEAISAAAQDTRVEYNNILDLNGVMEFKKYAHNRIDLIDLIKRQAELTKQIAAVYEMTVDQAMNGQTIDEALVQKQSVPLSEERDKITGQIKELNEEAADLAEKLNID